MYKIKELADLAGVSVRALHHYDEIGLFTPEKTNEAGYRLYSEENLEELQQILFFKELGFPLKEIKMILNSPSFDRREALALHRKMLLEKRRRLDRMIATLDKTIQHTKGEIEMTDKEKFEGFDFSRNPYEQEARERWGDKAVDRSKAKIASMSREDQAALSEKMSALFEKLAALRDQSPESDEAQTAIQEWYNFLQQFGDYSPEAFKGLGQMYVDDERFTKNIDKYGDGLARFMRNAMKVYADHH